VFDPPHVNVGKNSNMAKDYGAHTTEDIRSFIVDVAKKGYEVCLSDALMAFKWNDHDQSLDSVLSLIAEWWEPLELNILVPHIGLC
jgi:hypothetical protein